MGIAAGAQDAIALRREKLNLHRTHAIRDHMPASIKDILEAYDFASVSGAYENHAYVCRRTGKIYTYSSYEEELEEDELEEKLPDDIEDEEKYAPLPDKDDLNLGKRLIQEFAREFLPNDYDQVRSIFSRRGAYAKFKDLLARRNMLQQWYDFEAEATERALREWCKANGIAVAD